MADASDSTTKVPPGGGESSLIRHLVCGLLLLAAVAAAYLVLHRTGALSWFMDSQSLKKAIERAGAWGPIVIIGLFMIAIVVNPLPSAPIAIAAGFAYGHLWGTLYVIIGSVTGAFIAFSIARLLGRDILHRWFGDRLKVGLLGSQWGLTGTVAVLRLLPFVSFDIVSYAAGLTDIAWWRFILATTVGIIPVSFLLAHFGSEMGSGDPARVGMTVLLLGLVTAVPILVRVLWKRRGRGSSG